jgi:hypothetical protein
VVGVIEKANNETLYVATEGQPYPVSAQSNTGQGGLDFLNWNKPVDVQAPPPDQVVDLSKFTGKWLGRYKLRLVLLNPGLDVLGEFVRPGPTLRGIFTYGFGLTYSGAP